MATPLDFPNSPTIGRLGISLDDLPEHLARRFLLIGLEQLVHVNLRDREGARMQFVSASEILLGTRLGRQRSTPSSESHSLGTRLPSTTK